MLGNEWKIMFGHNTSHFARWNRDVCKHSLPLTTQWTYHHLYEINTSVIREISNRHFVLFCARRWIKDNDVNLSISWWRNFCRWQNNNLQSLSNLPPICLLHWKLEHCCSLNRLVIASFWPSFRICRPVTRCCTFIRKKGPRSTFAHFTQNKSSLFQNYHLKLSQVCPYLQWQYWWDKWPIDTILPSSSSNTMSQIIYTKLELVIDWCKLFQIRPRTIVTWTRYATNYFSSNDSGVTMFHRIFLNCRAMSIWRWWAPSNSPHTIPAHTLLNLKSLKSQNKCLIPNNPTWFAIINIWTNEATWHCVNFRSREIHKIMLVWIAL